MKSFGQNLTPIFNDEKNSVHKFESENTQPSTLPVNVIKPRAEQPRKHFDEEAHYELVHSIKEQGIIQPIVVRSCDDGTYEIVVGERRWRAAQEVGLKKIPVLIKDFTKQNLVIVALMENIHRRDLNPIEKAQALESLVTEFSLTHMQVAEKVGGSRTAVTNLLRLLELHSEVQLFLKQGLMEMGHARALLSLNLDEQIEAAQIIIYKRLNVRQTEALVNSLKLNNKNLLLGSRVNETLFETEAWKNQLSEKLGRSVNLSFSKNGKGRVVINFNSSDEVKEFIENL